MSKIRRCYECGGNVISQAQPGRTMPYKNIPALELPAALEIPTCESCGETFFDEQLDKRVDVALEAAFKACRTKKHQTSTIFDPNEYYKVVK